jgi:hypothetical protein
MQNKEVSNVRKNAYDVEILKLYIFKWKYLLILD